MTDSEALAAFIADEARLTVLAGALDEYRSLLRCNRETAVSSEEVAYFDEVISLVDDIVRILGFED